MIKCKIWIEKHCETYGNRGLSRAAPLRYEDVSRFVAFNDVPADLLNDVRGSVNAEILCERGGIDHPHTS